MKMLEKLEKQIDKKASYYFKTNNVLFKNRTDENQLIASLTKPMIYFFYLEKIQKELKINLTSLISNFLDTKLKVTLKDLLDHKSGVYDYFEQKEEKINSSTLEEICTLILKNSNSDGDQPYSYSNSGFVLLSLIIEKITKKSYQISLAEFYNKRNINITFDSLFPNYLAGWGDGAINCSVSDYLKFISLPNAGEAFHRLKDEDKTHYHTGFVPGFETLACFNNHFQLIIFFTNSDDTTKTDHYLDIIEELD